jgi:hypothetical protein
MGAGWSALASMQMLRALNTCNICMPEVWDLLPQPESSQSL